MSMHDGPGRYGAGQGDRAAQAIVMTQYRCLMAGYATGDVTCWDIAWNALETTFSVVVAKALYGEFHHFVRTLREGANADVGWRPAACRVLCRDECIILALLAAAQRGDPRTDEVAARLVAPARVPLLAAASRSLAAAIDAQGVGLPPLPCGVDAADWLRERSPSVH